MFTSYSISLLSPFCASRQPDRHARNNRTQLTANILNLPKKTETFCLKARGLLPAGLNSPVHCFQNVFPMHRRRPHNQAATTARFSSIERTIRPQRPHNSAPSNARCKQLISKACRQTIKKLPLLFLIRPADSEKQRQYND